VKSSPTDFLYCHLFSFSVKVWMQADLKLGEAELRRMELHAPDVVFEGRKASPTNPH